MRFIHWPHLLVHHRCKARLRRRFLAVRPIAIVIIVKSQRATIGRTAVVNDFCFGTDDRVGKGRAQIIHAQIQGQDRLP